MTFKLLALDVDGTLIAAAETIAPEAAGAVAAAEAAGLQIVLTTGRNYAQTVEIWRQLRLARPYQPLVLVSGALVAEPDTGRSLYQRTIPRELACQYADSQGKLGYTTLAFVDPWRHGVDYFVAESADAEDVQQKWFSRTKATVRRVGRLADASGMPDPLRLSAIAADRPAGEALAAAMRRPFDGRLCVNVLYVPAYDVVIVEATAARADKWTALMYVAQGCQVQPREIVAVGDDSNDLSMIRRAGLGVAMPCGPQYVRDAADHVASNGLAGFIHELLAGKFDDGRRAAP